MNNKKSTKRALISSVLSLVLCMSMLIGTTFAWFTDNVSSANNKIVAGNLKVDLELLNKETNVWNSVKTDKTPIFDYELWEPGYVDVKILKVENEGNLALKWKAQFVSSAELTGLADVIDVYVKEGVDAYPANRDDIKDWTKVGTVSQFVNTIETTTTGELEANKSETLGIALKMQESAGNEYQGMDLGGTFDIVVTATQLTAEDDSFDNQYDVNAEFDGEISNVDNLKAAFAKGGTYKVMKDITLPSDQSLAVPEGVEVVLDLAGNTITGTMHKNVGAVIKNEGTLTVKGGTISSTANNGGSAIQNSGTAVVENVVLNGAPNADESWPSYAVNNTGVMTISDSTVTSVHGGVASYGTNAVLTLNDTDIDMTGIPGFTSHGIFTYDNGKVIVKGGNIANNATDQNSTGASVINGNVEVISGTFTGRIENYYGTPVIKGGSFSVKPNADFIAADHNILEANGRYNVVNGKVATDNATLSNEIKNDANVYLPEGNFTLPSLSGKEGVTLVGTEGTVVGGDSAATGFRGNFGKDTTIKNITFTGSSNGVRYSYANGGNTVFENCTFAGDSVYGFHIDQSNGATFTFINCTFSGFNAFAGDLAKVTFENCTFLNNGNYGHTNIWSTAEFNNCTFGNGTSVGPAGNSAKIYINGELISGVVKF